MPRPPDDRWEDVIQQVQEAFAELDLDASSMDDAIVASIKAALEAAFDELPDGVLDGPDTPRVVVLDGGKDPEAPDPTDEVPRPDLRVAEPTEAAPLEESGRSKVRVVRVGSRTRPSVHTAPLAMEGPIHVRADRDAWQTLFRGAEPRTYRIACASGAMEIAVDGVLADRIEAGQSVDVEARLIRVRAGSDDPITGRYARIP